MTRSALVSTWIVLAAALSAAGEDLPVRDLGIASLTLTSLSSTEAVLTFRLQGTASRSARLRSLAFQQVRVNGMTVRIPAITDPIDLQEGRSLDGVPPLQAVIPFRELESLRPIREIVDTGQAEVRGIVEAQVELTLFQKLALRAHGVWAVVPVAQQVNVELPGGLMTAVAGRLALFGAEPAWLLAREAVQWREAQSAWARSLRNSVEPLVCRLETRYRLEDREGKAVTVSVSTLGFLVAPGTVLTVAETVEPWLFDNAVAEALERKQVRIAKDSLDIVLRTGNASYSLLQGQVRIRKAGSGRDRAIAPKDNRTYSFRRRASPGNCALLEVELLKSTPTRLQAPYPLSDEWQSAGVFRQSPDGTSIALVTSEARQLRQQAEIREPLDRLAIGSPVAGTQGIAALLQDSVSAIPLSVALDQLDYRQPPIPDLPGDRR